MHRDEKDKIYSKRVRAGKRTYFFDVRSTRANDFYLTITESRRFQKEGDFVFEKSKMFIYKEDFNKFIKALGEAIDYVKTDLMPDFDFDAFNHEYDDAEGGEGQQEGFTAEAEMEEVTPAPVAVAATPITDAAAASTTASEEVDKW